MTGHPYPAAASGDPVALVRRENTVNRLLLRRSARGIVLDLDAADDLKAAFRREAAEHTATLARHGFDVEGSDHALTRAVIDRLDAEGLLGPRWPRLGDGRASADKRWVTRLEDPRAVALRGRNAARMAETRYVDGIVDLSLDGVISPRVNVLAARTGRMSYSEPPLQQYPDELRRMMTSDVALVSLDWSSVEPVLAAAMARDAAVYGPFEDGQDLYLPIAEAAGVDRSTAKVVLLGLLYGMGRRALAAALGVEEDAAAALSARVRAAMPGVAAWSRTVNGAASRFGCVPTMSGRIVPVEADRSGDGFAGFRGTNYVVQGSAYDLLAEVLAAVDAAGLGDAVFAAVHDELVVHADAAADVERIMRTAPPALVEAAGRVPVLRTDSKALGHRWEPKK
jgi:DNA polymerase-1